ncbi:MAG: MBL fold metallo-hydrolase [Gammaproteobacteria bacterium]|nr:MBL fold metallo-hydrolase [Gammaproteobacteria bacterium]
MQRVFTAVFGLLIATQVHAGAHTGDGEYLFPGMLRKETEQLAEGVYAFRYTFYRNVFIVTDEGVIATDPMNAKAAAALRQAIAEVTDQPVRYVAYSHSHWDHSSGGQLFKDEGAEFVAQARCAANHVENPNPAVVPPDITFDDYYKIALGGKSLEMFYFGPSHDNCLVAMVINPGNLLFMVDTANPPSGWQMFYNPAVAEDRVWNMVRWHDRVESLIHERGIETVIGAHMNEGVDPETGKVVIVRGTTGPARVVSESRDFWKLGIEAVREELAAGTAPADVPSALVENGTLSDRILGYKADAALIWFQRLTSYAVTGE